MEFLHKSPHCCGKNAEVQREHDIKKIYKVLIVCGSFMLLEIWGHWTSNTLSLLADSLHLLVDFLGFLVSLCALKWTKRKANDKMTFGYERIEIVGALFSIFLIWGAVIYLLLESYHKYQHPHIINEKIFFVISVIGFGVNIICLFFLHEKHIEDAKYHENLNIRAAYVHVIGDLIQSVGVLIAGTVTYFYPKLVIVDILCTILFSVIVLCTTAMILKDGIWILIESVPNDIDIEEVRKDIFNITNVIKVINIHVWSLSANIKASNICLLVDISSIKQFENVLSEIKRKLHEDYRIKYVTIQLETYNTYFELANHGNSGIKVSEATEELILPLIEPVKIHK